MRYRLQLRQEQSLLESECGDRTLDSGAENGHPLILINEFPRV